MIDPIPESGHGFEEMMRQIDAEFIRDGLPIPNRSLHAIMAIGKRFNVPMVLTPPSPQASPELQQYSQLCKNIHDWFEKIYGDRTKVDFSPGKTVLTIDGDLYCLALPRIFGAAQFVATRQFLTPKPTWTQGPATCNILQLVETLTPAKAATLSDQAVEAIIQSFRLALEAHDLLEATQHKLIQIARGDIQTAVTSLMDKADRFGESRWSSLQAAEKILKAAVEIKGASYKFGHDLAAICHQLDGLGATFDWSPIVVKIQCAASVRYGEITCTRDDAVKAHQASLELVVSLANAGVKLNRSLG